MVSSKTAAPRTTGRDTDTLGSRNPQQALDHTARINAADRRQGRHLALVAGAPDTLGLFGAGRGSRYNCRSVNNMQIVINGQQRVLNDGLTVADLVRQLQLVPERVAVEVNGQLVRRAVHADTPLRDGDRVEIVTLVGGG